MRPTADKGVGEKPSGLIGTGRILQQRTATVFFSLIRLYRESVTGWLKTIWFVILFA